MRVSHCVTVFVRPATISSTKTCAGIEIGGPQMSQSVQRVFNVRDKLDPERHDVVFLQPYALLVRGWRVTGRQRFQLFQRSSGDC